MGAGVPAGGRPPPLQLRVRPADALTPSDRSAIVALCEAAFDEDFGRLFELLPGSTHVLAHLGGTLVSHACWVTRQLQPGALPPLRAAYVEAVATLPAYGGRGYGSAVMTRLAAEIARGDYDLGALAPARYAFYERLGWERWRGPTAIRTDRGLLPTPDDDVLILRLPRTPELDLDAPLSAEWREGELW